MPARVLQSPRRNRLARGDVRQFRLDARARVRPAHGVAHHARRREEDLLTARLCGRRGLRGGRELRVVPRLEFFVRLDDDRERHVRVLVSAELCALAAVRARAVGAYPRDGLVARNEVGLAVQVRNPEAVYDIVRGELEEDGLTLWNVYLVGRRQDVARSLVVILR